MFELRSLRRVPLVVLVASLAGCAAVGPDYRRPAAALDAGFVNAGATATNAQATAGYMSPAANRFESFVGGQYFFGVDRRWFKYLFSC